MLLIKNSNLATIDPAPIMNNKTVEELTKIFLNDSVDLFTRYRFYCWNIFKLNRAMFTLRNLKGDDCVEVWYWKLHTH